MTAPHFTAPAKRTSAGGGGEDICKSLGGYNEEKRGNRCMLAARDASIKSKEVVLDKL